MAMKLIRGFDPADLITFQLTPGDSFVYTWRRCRIAWFDLLLLSALLHRTATNFIVDWIASMMVNPAQTRVIFNQLLIDELKGVETLNRAKYLDHRSLVFLVI